jgi:hypothetical protein
VRLTLLRDFARACRRGDRVRLAPNAAPAHVRFWHKAAIRFTAAF